MEKSRSNNDVTNSVVRITGEEEVSEISPTQARASFTSDMLKLVSGTIFAQVVALLATPVITRLFAPQSFGVAAAITSLVSIAVVVLFLRYDQAIVLPDNDHDAAALFGVSIVIGSMFSLLIGLMLWFWGDKVLGLVGMHELSPFKWLILANILINIWYVPLSYWNTRIRTFGRISSALIVNSTGTSILRIGPGLAGYTTSGMMVIADLLGTFFATIFLGWRTFRSSGSLFRESISISSMKTIVGRYLDQPRYGTGAILLNTISWQLPVFVLTAFFSPAVAGQYALGQRIIRIPMSILGNSISRVFFARAATARFDGTLTVLTRGVFRQLVIFGIAPTLFLLFEGSNLFTLLFGEQWSEAGEYVELLALWSFVWFISSPLSQLQAVLEKQRFFLLWTGLNLVSRFLSLWIGAIQGNIYLALLLFGISGVILYGYLVLYLMYCADIPPTSTLLDLGAPLAFYIPASLIIIGTESLDAPTWLQLVIAAIALCVTFIATVRNDPVILKMITKFSG